MLQPAGGVSPIAVEHPATLAELAAIVKQAARQGHRLKILGAGQAANGMAATDGVLIHLGNYRRVLRIDPDRGLATAQAGISLGYLNLLLGARGLSLAHPGGASNQSLGGAISTSGHGTGVRSAVLASQVTALDLIGADGSVLSCSAGEEPEIFDAARVGLGALGVVSTVTLRCVPGFNLRSVTQTLRLDDVLAGFDCGVDAHDHFGFTWLAPTAWAVTTWRDLTGEPPGGRRVDRGLVAPLLSAKRAPAWPPAPVKEGHTERGYRVLCRRRRGTGFGLWMEYSVPRPAAVPVLQRVRELMNASHSTVPFLIRVGVAAADDLPLSTATGRPSAYIAVHVPPGVTAEPSLRRIEAILDSSDGRPQWDGFHSQTAATLRPRYAQWDSWQAIRRKLDPDSRLGNGYLERVLG